MKFIKYASVAAAVAMLASCSSDNLGGGEPDPIEPGTGVAYLNIGLQLSNNPGGRGYGDDDLDGDFYDQGTAEEYAVEDGVVYVFVGTGDDDARYVAKGLLDKKTLSLNQDTKQLSTEPMKFKNITINDFDVNGDASYYALVILNPDATITVPAIGESFLEWSKKPVAGSMIGNNKQICMSNATKIVNGAASTLVKINATDISKTEFDESQEATTNIYVQRNVAKVTVVKATNGYNSSFEEDGFSATAGDPTWALQVIQKTTYPVMNYANIDWTKNYMHSGWTTYSRAFWAVDPNYDNTEYSKDDFPFDTIASTAAVDAAVGTSVYCLENTMNYNALTQDRTTGVIIKATWTPSKDDYNFEDGFFYINRKIWDTAHLLAAVKNAAQTILNTENVEVTMANGLDGGTYSFDDVITSIKSGEETADTEVTEAQKEQIAASSLSLPDTQSERIAFYSDNEMYYAVRIRHFTDTELYGETKNHFWPEGTTEYNYAETDLGRYGVVRNNSYTITIAGIAGLGTPGIPELTTDPDDPGEDELSSNLRANINILSWAKRSQSETLGGN